MMLTSLIRSLSAFRHFGNSNTLTKHRSHSAAFKRQVAEEFIAGETLHALSKRHDISRQLIRIWVGKFEAGALDDDVQAADLIRNRAKIAALERMVGRQALEIELLKGALSTHPGREARTPPWSRVRWHLLQQGDRADGLARSTFDDVAPVRWSSPSLSPGSARSATSSSVTAIGALGRRCATRASW